MKDFIRNLKNKQKCCHEYNDNGCDPKKCNYYFLCDDVPVFVHTFRILLLITFLHSTAIVLLTETKTEPQNILINGSVRNLHLYKAWGLEGYILENKICAAAQNTRSQTSYNATLIVSFIRPALPMSVKVYNKQGSC